MTEVPQISGSKQEITAAAELQAGPWSNRGAFVIGPQGPNYWNKRHKVPRQNKEQEPMKIPTHPCHVITGFLSAPWVRMLTSRRQEDRAASSGFSLFSYILGKVCEGCFYCALYKTLR